MPPVMAKNWRRPPEEVAFLEAGSPGLPVLGMLPADPAVKDADRLGVAAYDFVPSLRQAVVKILKQIRAQVDVRDAQAVGGIGVGHRDVFGP